MDFDNKFLVSITKELFDKDFDKKKKLAIFYLKKEKEKNDDGMCN